MAPSLETLREAAAPCHERFSSEHLAPLPTLAQRYLAHAIAPGTPLASAVRLKMRGELKLSGWFPFTAEQVLSTEPGSLWKATVRAGLLPIRGFDQLLKGQGSMEWKLLGLLPMVRSWSADTTRSAIGRLHAESIWLPSLLLRTPGTLWRELPQNRLAICQNAFGECTTLTLQVDSQGRASAMQLLRWGEQPDKTYGYRRFGGCFSAERTFQGYTIPTEVQVGWDYDLDGPADWEGAFFRATIIEAQFYPPAL